MLKLAAIEKEEPDLSLVDVEVEDYDESVRRMLMPDVPDSPSDSTDDGVPTTYNVFYRNSFYKTINAYVFYKSNNRWKTSSLRMNPYSARWMATPDHRRFYSCARASGHRFRCWQSHNVPDHREYWIHEFSC